MKAMRAANRNLVKELWHFVLHLRWHYQLFILSGGFLLGGLLSSGLEIWSFIIQFLNVHLLLFGGATVYNSYWDKDEGPIGGLKHPPKIVPWMWGASLIFQFIGFGIAIREGVVFTGIYGSSMFFFWLYSTPLARWKGHPIKSLVAIGVSTGLNAVLMGYLAAGNSQLPFWVLVAALGASLLLLSLYPISQIYQQDEDRKRGDRTFAVRYGKRGVERFFIGGFTSGLVLVALAMGQSHVMLSVLFGVVGLLILIVVYQIISSLDSTEGDYSTVMWIKYGTSLGFVCFLIASIILKHIEIDGISWVAKLLLE
ncbi:UbiA family prenyltransferase [Fodinibius sp. Rm-B-1B1-1]|uniref:UbiA family prenyltransferase n=1 Tax=Fodinibius alkaliphilus TaxID=3140241 RepID=UPI00315B0E45